MSDVAPGGRRSRHQSRRWHPAEEPGGFRNLDVAGELRVRIDPRCRPRRPGAVGHQVQQPAALQVDQTGDPSGRRRRVPEERSSRPSRGPPSPPDEQRRPPVGCRGQPPPASRSPSHPEVTRDRGQRVGVLADPPTGLSAGSLGQHLPGTDRGRPPARTSKPSRPSSLVADALRWWAQLGPPVLPTSHIRKIGEVPGAVQAAPTSPAAAHRPTLHDESRSICERAPGSRLQLGSVSCSVVSGACAARGRAGAGPRPARAGRPGCRAGSRPGRPAPEPAVRSTRQPPHGRAVRPRDRRLGPVGRAALWGAGEGAHALSTPQ